MRTLTRASFTGVILLVSGLFTVGCGGDGTTVGTGATGGTGGAGGQGGDGGQGGAACADGETQSCYSGDPGTNGVGTCVGGTSTCSGGQWGACVGEVLPAAETCSGVDEDCDGQIDNGIAPITCGMGICQVTVSGCDDGKVPPCEPGTPEPAETCDGADDDCDGQIDEGCSCTEGQTQSCYSGGDTTKDVGACKSGTQSCVGGQWGACEGEVLPSVEACDALDNDCNGQTDDGFTQLSCGAGACAASVDACLNGVPQTCTPGQPETETCNGIDDDCNLFIDDNLGTTTCGIGACAVTVPACAGGLPQTCTPGTPTSETCDGIDNNCNGSTDENNPEGGSACMTGEPGVCATGVMTCSGGSLQCVPSQTPSSESCDNKDNDCDGVVDDGNPGGGIACNTGQLGVCASGTTTCSNGGIVCTQSIQPSSETCDSLDNNCNGVPDEGNPGGGGVCTVPGKLGPCAQSTQVCQNGTLGCPQVVFATPELCNGVDDNCNGTIDEGNPESGGSCSTGLPGACSPGAFQCIGGGLVCVQTTTASPEICDAKDNDCDGMTDEGNPGGGGVCSTGQPGVCATGTNTCTGGALVCTPNQTPQSETCDGLDNNCNGQTDEGNPGGGASCNTGLQGICAAGTRVCSGGALVCNPNQTAQPEVCDGLDNDCDGTVDDGNPGGGSACTVPGQQGECANGTMTCSGGTLTCPQSVMAVAEVCGDGKDNDCNGVVDNGCSSACDINGAALPLPIAVHPSNFFGGIDFDGNCDILVTGGFNNAFYRVNKTTGAVTTLTSGTLSTSVVGVAHRKSDNLIYIAVDSSPRLFSMPMSGGNPTLIMSFPTTITDIAVAPAGFGAHANKLIGSGFNGSVYAIDPATASYTVIGTTSGYLSDLAFAPDGSYVYLANQQNSRIDRMTPSGVFSTFVTGLSGVDGLAMDSDGTRLWAAHYTSGNTISQVTIPGAVVTTVTTSALLDAGWYTTGLLVDASDEVFLKSSNGTSATIRKVP